MILALSGFVESLTNSCALTSACGGYCIRLGRRGWRATLAARRWRGDKNCHVTDPHAPKPASQAERPRMSRAPHSLKQAMTAVVGRRPGSVQEK
jgi:hypothetical protein